MEDVQERLTDDDRRVFESALTAPVQKPVPVSEIDNNDRLTDSDRQAFDIAENRNLPRNLGEDLLTTVYNPHELSVNQRAAMMATHVGDVARAFGRPYIELGENFKAGKYGLSEETTSALLNSHIKKTAEGRAHINNGFMDSLFTSAIEKLYEAADSGYNQFSRNVTFPAAEIGSTAVFGALGTLGAVIESGVSAADEAVPGLGENVQYAVDALPIHFPMVGFHPIPRSIARQISSGAIYGDDVFMGVKNATPEQAAAMRQARGMYPDEYAGHFDDIEDFVPKETKDVNAVARDLNPTVFSQFDRLNMQRDYAAQRMRELREGHAKNLENTAPQTADIAAKESEISELQRKIELSKRSRGEEGKIEKLKEQIDDLKADRDDWIKSQPESDDLAAAREEYNKHDYAMRDMATDVSAAYRDAETRMPPKIEEPEVISIEEIKASPEPEIKVTEEPKTGEAPVSSPDSIQLKPIAEQRSSIIEQETKKLLAAGRPAENASIDSELVAEHYIARAERFKDGKGGTPQELYERDAAEVRTSRDKSIRGKYRKGKDGQKPITFLTGEQNASTYMHEKGHEWLDELIQDAKHEHATDQVKKDADAALKWMGVEKDAAITTRAHEKFARGFERFLMEGVAPNKALARVFQQLKEWFTAIYETEDRLKAPINDDMRNVYARLLAPQNDRIVIAPDHAPGKMMSDIHVADAATTEPKAAASVSDNIETEIDRTVRNHNEEIENALRAADTQESGTGSTGQTVPVGTQIESPGGPVAETGPAGGGQVAGAAHAEEPAGGGGSAAQSGGVPASGETGAAARTAERAADEPKLGETPDPARITGPTESAVLDKAGNIVIKNLERPDQIGPSLIASAQRKGDFLASRGEPVSDIQRSIMAQSLGLTTKEFTAKQPEGITNSAWTEAVQKLTIQAVDEVDSAAAKLIETGSPEDALSLVEAESRLDMIASYFSKLTAESGRTQRVFRKKDMSVIKDAQQKLEMLQNESGGRDLNQVIERAKARAKLDSKEKRAKFDRDSKKPGFFDMLLEFRGASMLWQIITQEKSIIDNVSHIIGSIVETAVGEQVGKVAKALGREATGIHEGEAKVMLFSLQRGWTEGLAIAKEIIYDEDALVGATQLDRTYKHAIPGQFGKVVRFTFRGLSAGDKLMQAINVRMKVNQIVYRNALKEGLEGEALHNRMAELLHDQTSGILQEATKQARTESKAAKIDVIKRVEELSKGPLEDLHKQASEQATAEGLSGDAAAKRIHELKSGPSQEILDEAKAFAEYQVLVNKLGIVGSTFGAFLNVGKVFKLLLPFYKVNINSLKYNLVDRQLYGGVFKKEVRDNLAGKNGATAEEMAVNQDVQIAKLALGSAVSGATAFAIWDDRLTGGGPVNPNERASWMQNHRPYSIRIGDHWYSYQWIPGIATSIGVAANAAEAVKHGLDNDDEIEKIGSNAITVMGKYVLDIASMRGMSDFIKVMNDSRMYGENYIESMVSSFVPAISGHLANTIDPRIVEVHGVGEAIESRVPFLKGRLQAKVDVFGEEMINPTALPVVNPVQTSINQDTPLLQRMQSVGYFPAPVGRKMLGVELTDQQYHDYAVTAGRLVKQYLENDVMSDVESFDSLEPGDKIKQMRDAVDYARQDARDLIMVMYGDDINRRADEAQKKLLHTGRK